MGEVTVEGCIKCQGENEENLSQRKVGYVSKTTVAARCKVNVNLRPATNDKKVRVERE